MTLDKLLRDTIAALTEAASEIDQLKDGAYGEGTKASENPGVLWADRRAHRCRRQAGRLARLQATVKGLA